LQFSQFEFVTEKTLGLAHNCSNDVLSLDRSIDLNISANLVLHRLALLVAATAARVVSFIHVNVSFCYQPPRSLGRGAMIGPTVLWLLLWTNPMLREREVDG
jgi:hypothetical protein